MSLPVYIADAAHFAFPSGLSIGDPTIGHEGNAGLRDYLAQLVAKLWTLVTDNLAVLGSLLLLYLCLEFGGTLYKWVRSGFGKWDDNNQGSLW